MPPDDQNVIQLSRVRIRSSTEASVDLRFLSIAVSELDDLRRCLESIAPRPGWSPQRWRVACTPLVMRLPAARRSLADLKRISADRWSDVTWALRLSGARAEAERSLQKLTTSMRPLVEPGTFGSAATGAVAAFGRETFRLATGLERVCDLVTRRYPEAMEEN